MAQQPRVDEQPKPATDTTHEPKRDDKVRDLRRKIIAGSVEHEQLLTAYANISSYADDVVVEQPPPPPVAEEKK